MAALCAVLNKCKTKAVALTLTDEYADSFAFKSQSIPTMSDLFEEKYLDLSYPELLHVCAETEIQISEEHIQTIERDTITQSKGKNFFRHRLGRIGASQNKSASHTDPAYPSQSLIQTICYPELHKLNTKAVVMDVNMKMMLSKLMNFTCLKGTRISR